MRSPLAIARNKFIRSEEGRRLWDATTLGCDSNMNYYLSNRIEHAFLQGVAIGEKLAFRKDTIRSGTHQPRKTKL